MERQLERMTQAIEELTAAIQTQAVTNQRILELLLEVVLQDDPDGQPMMDMDGQPL